MDNSLKDQTHLTRDILVAQGDRYWSHPLMSHGDLHDVFRRRRDWIKDVVRRKLAENYIFIFQESSAGFGDAEYLVEGIDDTSVVWIRSVKKSMVGMMGILPPNAVMDILIYKTSNAPTPIAPFLVTTHMELGTDSSLIAGFLSAACFDYSYFVDEMHTVHKRFFYVDEQGNKTPFTPNYKCRFKKSPQPTVMYQGLQKDNILEETKDDTACNIDIGAGDFDNNGTLEIEVETVIVKAY